MLGGLLGGLIGGAIRNAIAPRIGVGGRGGVLADLADRQPAEEGRRRPQPTLQQPTIGKTGSDQPQADKPSPMEAIGPAQQERPSIGESMSQRSAALPAQPSQEPRQSAGLFQSERPIEPPSSPEPEPQAPDQGPEQETPPVFQDAKPMEIEKVDITQGVQEPEIQQQTQQLPPTRYTPTPNALPAVHPRASTGSLDKIQTPDMGYGFQRPEGVEQYAAKFTYRRR